MSFAGEEKAGDLCFDSLLGVAEAKAAWPVHVADDLSDMQVRTCAVAI